MKIIATDGYARDSVADRLVADNITNEVEGSTMLMALRSKVEGDPSCWYLLVSDDYRLSRGMEDLV